MKKRAVAVAMSRAELVLIVLAEWMFVKAATISNPPLIAHCFWAPGVCCPCSREDRVESEWQGWRG